MIANLLFGGVFLLIVVLYGLMNYYIGLRGWQTLGASIPWLNSKVYWGFIWFSAFSFIVVRLVKNLVPVFAERWLALVGSYWMASFYYLFVIILLIDLIRIINKYTGFLPASLTSSPQMVGWLIVGVVAGLLIYGTWNARNPVVNHYDVTINKDAGDTEQLHVVMASDVHLGLLVDNKRLGHMVDMINELNPDVVLLPGDIVDESIEPFIEQKMADTFKKLNPPLGTFMVPGNHEHIGEIGNEIVHYMQEGGVRVLIDEQVKIRDSFYVVGRDDTGHGRRGRKPLNEIMTGMDKSLPIILLDHNPSQPSLQQAQEEGVDLQVSGHTHKGQFSPNNFVTKRIYEQDWGYLRKGNYQLIVSNGFGTWGPPIRIGNKPEIVSIKLYFRKN